MKKVTSYKLRVTSNRLRVFRNALILFLSYALTTFCSYGQTSIHEEPGKYEIDTLTSRAGCGNCFNESWDGHGNVVCNQYFKNEKDAVVRIEIPLLSGNCNYCSGALVNTTEGKNNNHHYILIAGHSLLDPEAGNPLNNFSDWKFYWHYEAPTCYPNHPTTSVPSLIYTTGAQFVAKYHVYGNLDFALLDLIEDPEEAWDVTPYYLGWDRSDGQTSGTGIHHPMGDIKKIMLFPSFYPNDGIHVPDWFWRSSTTTEKKIEGGSSGSPLLNSNRKLIGHCNRISSAIYSQYSGKYYWEIDYSKFGYAWNGWHNDPNPTGRLKDWLDPFNTDVMTLDGRAACQNTIRLRYSPPRSNYHAVENIISKQTIGSGVTTTYKAGTEIALEDGFHAKSGASFHAQIEELNCNGIPPNTAPPQNNENQNNSIEELNSQISQNPIPNKINLIPNPNNGSFNLETNFPLSDIAHLKIVNLMGVSVYETQTQTSNAIQLPNATPGQYFVVVILKESSVLTQKMMIQK
ncbi:MAG: T9SS type A sorting domain-containing protein [Bacteroidales bacterium]|jgi:hypothetical protein|nr:T9SS type A sorting domain-containing protein [Bacteroidales bacterium]